MSSRKVIGCAPLFDGERLGSVTAVEFLEAVHGDPRRSGDELQDPRAHFGIEGKNHLKKMVINGKKS